MKKKQLAKLGVPSGDTMRLAIDAVKRAGLARVRKGEIRVTLQALLETPRAYVEHGHFGELARALVERDEARARYVPRAQPAPYQQWGEDLDATSIEQIQNACKLPISVRGALMPDAHLGYGLPIGGVLATRGAVIPYAVGVDIACRMKLTVLDRPVDRLEKETDRLRRAIENETRFGIGAAFKQRRRHSVLDEDWSVSEVTQRFKDKAWAQLGSSGSGNHFVEFGVLTIDDPPPAPELGLPAGRYLALLSHSGSRGTGAAICDHYSRIARRMHPELPRELSQLAWLELDTHDGQAYWNAMQLMGKYAAANHELIHKHIAKALGADVLLDIENHHNFAWEEEHDGETVIVHRKGATPAGRGVLGIIPGTMATPAFIVRGKGSDASLHSAAHGAGRVMSRTQAKKQFSWAEANLVLKEAGVTLLSAGLDEVPMVYKNIEKVMAAQSDLVEPVARFAPKLVKMSPGGRAED